MGATHDRHILRRDLDGGERKPLDRLAFRFRGASNERPEQSCSKVILGG